MKFTTKSFTCLLAALSLLLSSCVQPDTQAEVPAPTTEDLIAEVIAEPPPPPAQLPVRYQNPGYVTTDDIVDEDIESDEEYEVKVGANITTGSKPQPLVKVLKGLARIKGMSVGWASDVNRFVTVDVDINAKDKYFDAINNLLRQVDYFHEVEGSTIIVKFKETKRFNIAMPYTTQTYETATGGNLLGSQGDTASIEGSIRLKTKEKEFDFWGNIEKNINIILGVVEEGETYVSANSSAIQRDRAASAMNANVSDSGSTNVIVSSGTPDRANVNENSSASIGSEGTSKRVKTIRQTSPDGEFFIVDHSLGVVTVTAKPSVLKKVEDYLDEVKEQLYKQVTIEAKIIEVQLDDSSTLGVDWNLLLRSMSFGGSMALGKSYTKDTTTDSTNTNSVARNLTDAFGNNILNTANSATDNDGVTTTDSSSTSTSNRDLNNSVDTLASAATTAATFLTGGASNIAGGVLNLADFNFGDFIHALSQQGNTSILANPKLSVMNGQPALITVGRNVTYIDSIESDIQSTAGNAITTFTVNTERILSGVGMALTPVIKGDDEIIMTLVPVTSVLEEPIEYRQVGLGEVGLPVINVREMSSMVQVKDGEMLVIGGLITSVERTEGENLFPGLANVPVLKYLTGYETKVMQKRELIILLRPRIL